jgi:hypothetical protein
MKRQTVITKKRRGPAPTGKGTLIGVRLQPPELKALDKWIADDDLSRPEAIRQLVEAALTPANPQSVCIDSDVGAAIDAWIKQEGLDLTRPEAIVRLVEIGLRAKGK